MARTLGSSGEDTSARIRKAALELIASQGYAAISIRQIAAKVGIQPGGLYNHFPTKQHILQDLLENHMNALIAAWEAESLKYRDPATALDGFIRFHIRFHMERQDQVFISYMELRNLEPENFRKIEALRRVYEGFLRKIINAGNQNGQFSCADVPVATMAILAMLVGVNTWFRANGRLTVDEVEEIYVSMVQGSLGIGNQRQDLRKIA
jgi:AcrR family transcriptional regulator